MSTLWEQMLQQFLSEYQNHPNDFLRQPIIHTTVHPNNQKLAQFWYDELVACSFCSKNVLPLRDSKIGNPFQFKQLQCSPMTIEHAHHIHLIHKHLDVFLPRDVNRVVETGGGYGNFCRLMNRLGYRGQYTIIDFQPMLDIQKDFLHKNSINDINFSTLKPASIIPKADETSMLLGTFSISEMPLKDRLIFEPIYSKYDYLYITHNTVFDGIDNVEYFKTLRQKLSNDFKITYIKDPNRRAWFLLCKNKRTKGENK